MNPDSIRVPMSNFSSDHWSLLVYLETRCVDHGGVLRPAHLRCNAGRHREMLGGEMFALRGRWQPGWGTELRVGQLNWHDDWDCLEDLEDAGLVETVSLAVPAVALTDKGYRMAAALRRHRAQSGNYRSFEPMTEVST